MSTLLKDGNIFLHIPKTGGSWVENVLNKLNLTELQFSHKHSDYDRSQLYELYGDRITDNKKMLKLTGQIVKNKILRKIPLANPSEFYDINKKAIRFCFVRNPLNWYESWWKYMQALGWNTWGEANSVRYWHPNSILNGLGSSDFNEFIEKVIHKRPGYVTEMFYSYTKEGINYIGKTENLKNDLVYILKKMGYDFDEQLLDQIEKENVSKTATPVWDQGLKEMMMRLELPSLIHFNYLTDQDCHNLGISPSKIRSNPNLIPANQHGN